MSTASPKTTGYGQDVLDQAVFLELMTFFKPHLPRTLPDGPSLFECGAEKPENRCRLPQSD